MSDIFISYSKADHALALKLSAFLESEGWSVWWDKSLAAARDEIMKQLAAARAVITIWSPNSVKSDWVRAEAGRAKAEGKLIPVKTPDVAYGNIPVPFGEMHTENVGSTDLIRAAIVAQLAKSVEQQAPFWQITKTVNTQLLTLMGIAGIAMSMLHGLKGFIDMADLVGNLIANWHSITQWFWGWVFGLIKINLPKFAPPLISFAVFVAMLIIGLNLRQWPVQGADKWAPARSVWKNTAILAAGMMIYLVCLAGLAVVAMSLHPEFVGKPTDPNYRVMTLQDTLLPSLFITGTWPIGFPIAYLMVIVREWLWVLIASLLFFFMGFILEFAPISQLIRTGGIPSIVSMVSGWVIIQFSLMLAILFSPLRQLTQKLVFVFLTVLMLIGLSEISKLNLHQYLQPSKVSDNSVR